MMTDSKFKSTRTHQPARWLWAPSAQSTWLVVVEGRGLNERLRRVKEVKEGRLSREQEAAVQTSKTQSDMSIDNLRLIRTAI
jgi:hypothetical protein